jgi:uncharacterized protein YbjT (DUF2867 family)
MILVTGATGNVGGHLVRVLCQAGAPVRALVRSPERANVLRGYDCHVAVGRFEDPISLDAALLQVDRVFLLSPAGPQLTAHEGAVIEAIRRHGGARVVKLAAMGVDNPDAPERIVVEHQKVVRMLDGMPHTVLAPNSFFQNLLRFAAAVQERSELPSAVPEAPVSYVDAVDVAAVAAHVLTSEGHEGATYTVTGPAAISHRDVAAALSSLLGREVRVVDLPPEQLRASELDPWLVEGMLEFFESRRAGRASTVTDEVQKATGRQARTVQDFLARHLNAFR